MSEIRKDDRLSGRVAIVTGAGSRTSGIGNGRARFDTPCASRRKGSSDRCGSRSRRGNPPHDRRRRGTSIALQADITQPDACANAVRTAVTAWGRLDILVNNVGIGGPPGTAVEVDLAAWEQALRVNVTTMMLMAKYAIPEMRKLGSGSIVNIASVAGLLGGHPSLLYPTSKGAVINMTRAMAAHHGTEGIRVNCIAPGMVYTPMVSSRGMSPELREARRKRSLLQTEGSGWDVGNAVIYLVSDEARWVTGVILPVDAGATAGSARVPIPKRRQTNLEAQLE